jgi:hypothetical protein
LPQTNKKAKQNNNGNYKATLIIIVRDW